MSWTTAGVQSGTDTDLSGLSGVTGTTVTAVGLVTIYTITANLTIDGTLTMDPLTEQLVNTNDASTTAAITISLTGRFNVGAEIIAGSGNGLRPITPKQTALILEHVGSAATSDFSIVINGIFAVYGACINVNASIDINSGCGLIVRDAIFYSQNSGGNCRLRCDEGAGIDIIGLETYGFQFDWLITEAFTNFLNYLALDKGIPTENATGTAGTRAWRVFPDNSYGADAAMNNWNGGHDVTITLAEVGSRTLIVPDSTTEATAHGGRIYHEFTVKAQTVLNVGIEGVICYLADYDNGHRLTTTTGPANYPDGDQVLTPATGSDGVTSLQTLLLAKTYRTNSVGDLTSPDGLERVDAHGKPYSVLAAVSGSTGVTGTFSSSDSSLPAMVEGARFVLNGSTSNDLQVWETTEDWTTAGGTANMLAGSSTNETENTMEMVVLGEDFFDSYLWGYGYLPYKFTDAKMNGLVQTDLVATLLEDSGITESNQATVDAYTTIDDLDELYDAAVNYKCTVATMAEPDIGTPLMVSAGNSLDLGDINLVVDSGAASAFAFNGTDTITIKPTSTLDVSATKTTIVTTGTITFSTASIGEGLVLNADTYLDASQDLTDVTVNADLLIDAPAPGSGITQVGATEAVSTGEDDEITIAFPAGIADDDVAYIAVGHAQSEENEWNTPSGWVIPAGLTEVQTGGTPASTPGVTVFRRVLSGDSGSVTITNVGTNTSGIVAQMIVYRGVDTTTPEDVAPVTASGASGDPNPASITTANANSMILAFGFQDHGDQTSPSQPSGYTAILDTATTDGAGTGES